MSGKKVVILDGCGVDDQDLTPVLSVLSEVLKADGEEIQTIHLRELNLAHCLGCFGCWIKTPGRCVEDDAGRQVARAFMQSDTAVLFTPVTFGGYSPDLKRMADHFIQLLSPYFRMDHGEVHHPARYAHRPRFMAVGVQRRPSAHEAQIFKTLAGRNAINLIPPSFAAEVVLASDDAVTLRGRFEALRRRCDALPYGAAAASLLPASVEASTFAEPMGAQRALLIVGSPKTNERSTSSVLGSYLLNRLGSGWETETLTLRANLNREEGEAQLLAAAERAGLILLVFPLYVDSLPFLVIKALAAMARRRRNIPQPPPQRMVAIVNSGFPEIHQNAVALAICREFAAQCGMAWAGGLALGGGGIVGGQPFSEEKRSRPPVGHIIRALDLTAAALAEGKPVPAEAVKVMTHTPIPFLPAALWRRLYLTIGGREFERAAARNGVSKDQMLAQPYAA